MEGPEPSFVWGFCQYLLATAAGASWVHPLYQVGWIRCVACGGQSHAPQAFPISTFLPRRLALLTG